MDWEQLIDRFYRLTVWRAHGERAQHKPLLVLLAPGYLQREGRRELAFTEIEEPLKTLFADFSPPRHSYKLQYPFYFL